MQASVIECSLRLDPNVVVEAEPRRRAKGPKGSTPTIISRW
jgi:hypothetical protein